MRPYKNAERLPITIAAMLYTSLETYFVANKSRKCAKNEFLLNFFSSGHWRGSGRYLYDRLVV